jgi:hypothetical protein
MRTRIVWLLIGAAFALLASQALARTLTKTTAGTKALDFGRADTPLPSAQVHLHGPYDCKRGKTTLPSGEKIDDPHLVYCEISEHREAVTRLACVVVTMKHKKNIIGQVSYPVSARRNSGPQTCPQP